jgi:hypothetical protein
MKKEYIKPTLKFHVLKFNKVIVTSPGDEVREVKYRYEQADEWSD